MSPGKPAVIDIRTGAKLAPPPHIVIVVVPYGTGHGELYNVLKFHQCNTLLAFKDINNSMGAIPNLDNTWTYSNAICL